MSKARAGAELSYKLPVPIGELVAGKYRVDGVLGRGGMGVVVAATDVELERRVAIKFVERTDEQATARFLNEARSAARLDSEHITRVFEVGRLAQGSPFIVMEQLSGEDLGDVVAAGPLELQRAAGYVMQICEALAQAHAARIVHRDLKPDNLFLHQRSDGRRIVKVLDFGISKALEGTVLTESQAIVGSPQYLAPEQIDSPESVDPRTDIWALGVVLYELVSTEKPFRGGTMAELCMNILSGEPPPLRGVGGQAVPAEFEALVRRCLRKRMAERFSNVAELAAALQPFSDPESGFTLSAIRRALGRAELAAASDREHAEVVVANTVRSRRPPRRAKIASIAATALVLVLSVAWFLSQRAHPVSAEPHVLEPAAAERAALAAPAVLPAPPPAAPAASSAASASPEAAAPALSAPVVGEPPAPPVAPVRSEPVARRPKLSASAAKAPAASAPAGTALAANGAKAADVPRCRVLEVIENGRTVDATTGRVTFEWARRLCLNNPKPPGSPYRLSDSGISVKCECD